MTHSTNLSTDREIKSSITDVIGAVVLFVAITLMYLNILKLILGIRREFSIKLNSQGILLTKDKRKWKHT